MTLEDAPALLYRAQVMHARLRPLRHRFRYRIWTLLLDIDRMGALPRLLAVDRRGIISFHTSDFGARDGSPLRPWVLARLAEAGIGAKAAARIRLLAMPRVLGYAFNPISLFLCDRADGAPGAIIYQVRNTFGGSHAYVASLSPRAIHRHASPKSMHVSPFNDMQGGYAFTLSRPAARFALRIDQSDEAGLPKLLATLSARAETLTNASLIGAVAAMPFVTLKVTAGIHWEALRLWLKGARYHPNPKPPRSGVTIAA